MGSFAEHADAQGLSRRQPRLRNFCTPRWRPSSAPVRHSNRRHGRWDRGPSGLRQVGQGNTGVSIDKSSRYSDWSVRPLAKRQIDYAAGDVTYLRGVYRKLVGLLEQQERGAWVDEEMAKIAVLSKYQNDPAQAYKRLKVRTDKAKFMAILQQLASWRELDAQNRDVPRGRIMRDDTLLDLASAEPTTVEDLKKIRGVSDKLAAGKIGKEIIRAVNLGVGNTEIKSSSPNVDQHSPMKKRQS